MNFIADRVCRQFGRILVLSLFVCTFFASTTISQNPINFEEFIRKLASGSVEEKRDVLYSLRNFGTVESSLVAIPALTDFSEIVRATAVASVVYLRIDEASRVLIPLLNDPSEYVRRETAHALGKVRSPNSLKPLLDALQNDKNPEVRAAAAVALGQLGESGAVKSLAQILETKPKSSENFLRRSAALSIGQIARSMQILEYSKAEPTSVFDDANWEATNPKYVNLTRFPEFRLASGVLIELLQNKKESDDAKREAAFALGEIADPAALEALKSTMISEDGYLAEISSKSSQKILNSIN
jgi:HEAT repeat protein